MILFLLVGCVFLIALQNNAANDCLACLEDPTTNGKVGKNIIDFELYNFNLAIGRCGERLKIHC